MPDRREISRIQARGQGVLRPWTRDEVEEWQKKTSAFRDSVAEAKLTGGAFVVAEDPQQTGVVPLMSVRGNALTLEAAIGGLIGAWAAQRRVEGLPVNMKAISDVVIVGMAAAGVEAS